MQVDLTLPEAEIRRRFPRFPGAGEAVEVTVEAGQALYLPASWFHEVTSVGSGDPCMHIAVNYWFHPPDHILGSGAAGRGGAATSEGHGRTRQQSTENVAAAEGKKGRKRKCGAVHGIDACAAHVEAEHAENVGQFPYTTDFWPSMWNARVDRHAWPAHLKVPLSGCD